MMLELPAEEESYWQSSAAEPEYPSLTQDVEADVAIVGGGIAGLAVAYTLKRAGFKVVVLEKNTLGSGTTSKTTGKLTAQHNLMYADLQKRLGNNIARTYADANQAAVEETVKIIKKEKIDCDLEIDDNYVFTTDPAKVSQFRHEFEMAVKLGLPATFETDTPLPFPVQAAVKFSNQAKFNAQKYVLGLAELVDGNGSHVFEHSNVTRFHDGRSAAIKTDSATVIAKDIVVATKIPAAPLVARGGYALLEHPHTSYIVAGKYAAGLKGMYISPDEGHHSILPVGRGKEGLLLIGGEHHTPGLRTARKRYRRLAEYAETNFGLSSIDYRWKGMDYIAYDDVPLIGKVYPWSRHLYTATGFKKWRLSTSMIAAMILSDSLQNRENIWAPVFNSMRLKPVKSIPRALIG